MTQPTLTYLHPNAYSQEFHYYPFAVKLNRCVGCCNILNDLSNKVCVPNKTENLNLSVFNINTGIHESKTLTKHISCECICRFDGRKCNSDQWWNSDKCRCECKKRHVGEKDYTWNPSIFNCENGKHLTSIIDDSTTMSDEIIGSYDCETKTIPTNFNEEKTTCKTEIFYILVAFLLITIALLIAASIHFIL